jgi:NAD-dependent dihydropyrimidine dehydrogenase PreA subunit
VKVLVCSCENAGLVPDAVCEVVCSRLDAAGVAYTLVPDLCRLAARRDPALRAIAADPDVRIAACYPRAVRWLFHAAAAPLPETARVTNMRMGEDDVDTESGDRTGIAPGAISGSCPRDSGEDAGGDDPWIPWFPVIDYDRCRGCRQCLNFCLFGVYGDGPGGAVAVRHPDKCKTNCPACARVCPEAAIVFPKYKDVPFNGAEVRPEDLEKAGVKVDPSKLAAGDLRAKLRARSGAGLADVKDKLDIPQSVIDEVAPCPRSCSCSKECDADKKG